MGFDVGVCQDDESELMIDEEQENSFGFDDGETVNATLVYSPYTVKKKTVTPNSIFILESL